MMDQVLEETLNFASVSEEDDEEDVSFNEFDKNSDSSVEEKIFKISDFTTVTRTETLARSIARILLKWKDVLEKDTLSKSGFLEETLIDDDGSFTPPSYTLSVYCAKRYADKWFKNLTFSKNNICSTMFASHTLQFYGGRVSNFQRWFGTPKYVSLSNVLEKNVESILNALIIGCQEAHTTWPCFVCSASNLNGRILGQYVGILEGRLHLFIYISDCEPHVPPNISPHHDVLLYYDLCKHFCMKMGLPLEFISYFGKLYGSCRFAYFQDDFSPLPWSFWDKGSEQPQRRPYGRNDPLTQIHLLCSWHLTEIDGKALEQLPNSSNLLDPWNPNECSWYIRTVGFTGVKDQKEFRSTGLILASISRQLLFHFIQLVLKKSITPHEVISPEHSSARREKEFSKKKKTVKAIGFLQSLGHHIDRALANALLPTESEIRAALKFIFDDFVTDDALNMSQTITRYDTFGFRLIDVLSHVKNPAGVIIIWKAIAAYLRNCWENGTPIPSISSSPPFGIYGGPDRTDSPLIQQLKTLNCCIHQKRVIEIVQEHRLMQNQFITNIFDKKEENHECIPIAPPINDLSVQLISIEELYNKEVNFSVTFAMMEVFLTCIDPKGSLENYCQWLKSSVDIIDGCCPSLAQLMFNFNPLQKSLKKLIGTLEEQIFIRNSIWDHMQKHINEIHSEKEETFKSSYVENLYSVSLYGEMAMHWLENLNSDELILELLRLFYSSIYHRYCSMFFQQPKVDVAFANLVNVLTTNFTILEDHCSSTVLGYASWRLSNLILNRKNLQHEQQPITDCIGTLDETAMSIQEAIEEFEFEWLLAASLEWKFNGNSAFVQRLIRSHIVDDECEIQTEDEKTMCLDLINTMNCSNATSPFDIEPINSEFLFTYIPNETTNYSSSMIKNPLNCFYRGYYSVMANEFRLALTSQIPITSSIRI